MFGDITIICRKALDAERENPWICECPRCAEQKKEIKSIVSAEVGIPAGSSIDSATEYLCQGGKGTL